MNLKKKIIITIVFCYANAIIKIYIFKLSTTLYLLLFYRV